MENNKENRITEEEIKHTEIVRIPHKKYESLTWMMLKTDYGFKTVEEVILEAIDYYLEGV